MSGGYKPKILIVDDEQKNIQVLGTVLIGAGYNVITASDGYKALEKLKSVKPDLIMLDIMMPVMDGMDTCVKIKSDPELSDIPVIFLTARIDKDDIIEGLRAGAVDYITKPFNQEELLCRVATHVDLVLSKRMLAERVRETSELIHVICHDLVNPIGSIKNLLSLVDEDEPIDDLKPMMESAVDRCLNIVELVRQMKAVENGKLKIKIAPVRLGDAVAGSLEVLSSMLKEKDIRAVVDIDPSLTVMAEQVSLMNSVISNIVTNALKFSDRGSDIKISAEEKDGKVTLTIKDSGIGIPANLIDMVFDPTKTTTRKGTHGESGTGFGMPLVKKFVNVYGGRIWLTSRERSAGGQEWGTSVHVEFDRA
ncbi:MAG: response regulator [Deferribacterales bacterium]